MSPRNRVRTAVAALGCVLIVQGALQLLDGRDADAAPCPGGSTGAGCTTVEEPAGNDRAPLPRPSGG